MQLDVGFSARCVCVRQPVVVSIDEERLKAVHV